MNTRTITILTLIMLSAAFLGGCNLPTGATPKGPEVSPAPPTQDQRPPATLTQPAASEEPQLPTAASTTTPTAEEPTPQPAGPREIKFLPGGTIYYVQGDITAGQRISYTFEAAAGQTLIVGVSSNDQDVYFEIKGLSDGILLTSFSERSSSLVTQLPETGVYQITLTSESNNVYFLSVEIPAELSVPAGSSLNIVKGQVQVLEEFYPNVMTRVRYILHMQAGSIFNVQLQSDGIEGLTLALTGKEDGVPYLRHVVKSEAINDFLVPVSQGYYLDVYSISGEAVDYVLEIEIRE